MPCRQLSLGFEYFNLDDDIVIMLVENKHIFMTYIFLAVIELPMSKITSIFFQLKDHVPYVLH